jgi:signal transduction histidine kinase
MPDPSSVIPVAPAIGESGPAIMAVDDSSGNLLAIQAALGDLGGEVVQAQSGDEALRLLLERDFALVLLDVKMPSLSGLETARLIRERKRSRHTPIIFITAHNRDDREVLAAYELGAVDFLFKPVAAQVLRAKAAVFIELQRRATELERQARLIERQEHARQLEEERRRWNDETVQRRIAELADTNRHKDEFLAILAHELRNPLAPIVTGLQVLGLKLAGEGRPDEVVGRARQAIERQVEHLRRLVDDLLDVSRINSGKIALRKQPVAIQEVVRQAVATSGAAIEARGHTLSLDLPPEPILVAGDELRLTQVFANLLNNAVQYTDKGGAIQVRCSRRGGDGTVEVRVADNGRGIEPDLLPRIFDMYAQARPGDGLGLGLAIVKRLTEMHGGSVSVNSAGPRRGSEFVVRLPTTQALAPVLEGPRPALEASNQNGSRPLVIALVEDNEDVREVTRDLLQSLGHTVQVAEDGEKGAALILSLKPDVALVDIGMPVMDGHGVAALVRAAAGGDRVRLVAMSGYGTESDRRRSREAGFDHHLVKPCDMATLVKALESEE